jgi:hypothetical protein
MRALTTLSLLLVLCAGTQLAGAQVFNPDSVKGTWMGSWFNTTFSSTGPATLVLTVLNDSSMLVVLDLDGFVGGMADPDAWIVNGKYDADSLSVDTAATEGTLRLRWSADDSVSWVFSNMTTPGFSSHVGGGIGRSDSINLTYTVFFTPSGSADGTVTLVKQSVTTVSDGISREDPQTYQLYANYPNPFNPATSISFSIASEEYVRLRVYNSLGEEVAELVNGDLPRGTHTVSFRATDLPSGVYYYSVTAGEFSRTNKMLLMK